MTEAIIALVALTAMEIVLGIDNVVFIAILCDKLPEEQRAKARTIGLGAALGARLLLLLAITWVMGLTAVAFSLTSLGIPEAWFKGHEEIINVTYKDLVMLIGGLFLIGKSVFEIHEKIEGDEHQRKAQKNVSFASVLAQIVLLDVIFSLDSVITAVGMAKPEHLWVMVTAIILAVGVMLVFAGKVSAFVDKHPTIKMLALSFLILIGVMLVAEGVGTHINKGYIYFAMAFALIVEFLNLKVRGGAGKVASGGKA